MTELVSDCPRCGALKITFNVRASNELSGIAAESWQKAYEAFCVCRECNKATVFRLILASYEAREMFTEESGCIAVQGSITSFFDNLGYISLKDEAGIDPPEHLPRHIENAFREGATCLAVNCFNAAATMFRLCVDYATLDLLPDDGEVPSPNLKQRRDLGPRLQWLFDSGKLAHELHDLAHCIKEDGNDGAHRGTLSGSDALDLLDFTISLLERRYTFPKKLEVAAARRAARPR